MIALILLAAYSAVFFISLPQPIVFGLFVLGLVIGFSMIYADRLLHALALSPEEEFSQLLQQEVKRGSVRGVIRLLYHAEGIQKKLLTRSLMFMGAYLALAVFILTSSGSVIGSGLILGMGLRYSLDMLSLFQTPEVFAQQFLSDIKRSFTATEVRNITFGWVIGFTLISIWAWV